MYRYRERKKARVSQLQDQVTLLQARIAELAHVKTERIALQVRRSCLCVLCVTLVRHSCFCVMCGTLVFV